MNSLKFSIQSKDITPAGPVFQAGFGSRTRKSESVLAPIYMKAVLMQANKTVLIVAIDAMGGDHSFVDGIKTALGERFGLKPDEVLLNFSHAHSSIYLTGLDASLRPGIWSLGQDHCPADNVEGGFEADEAYFRYLRDALIEMVTACYKNLCEGELSVGSAISEFAISRRVPLGNGKTDFAPNPQAVIDKQLSVFKLTEKGGALKGIVYAFGCHPTTLGDTYCLANDFISYTSAALEAEFPEATAIFLQACGAELKPWATVGENGFTSCDIPAVQAMGEVLAGEVSDIVRHAVFDTVDCHFNTALQKCSLPTSRNDADFYLDILKTDIPDDFFRYASAARIFASRLNGTTSESQPCYISVWQLDAKTHIVAIDSEVSTGYSLAIKNYFSRGNMVVLGYSNGVTCYIPTRKMIAEGGYEAESNYFFGLQGPFVPEIEDIIVGQVAHLLHEVK